MFIKYRMWNIGNNLFKLTDVEKIKNKIEIFFLILFSRYSKLNECKRSLTLVCRV